jgi:hypothetical protein
LQARQLKKPKHHNCIKAKNMKITKNKSGIISLVSLLLFAGMVLFPKMQKILFPVSLADDNEYEDQHRNNNPAPVSVPVSTTVPVQEKTVKTNTPKIEYKTIYQQLPDTVIDTITEVPRYDSDSDGIYDDEDAYPNINDFLIVKDDNLNGIDDRYEK